MGFKSENYHGRRNQPIPFRALSKALGVVRACLYDVCGLVVRAGAQEEEGEGKGGWRNSLMYFHQTGYKELPSAWLGPQRGRGREDELLYRGLDLKLVGQSGLCRGTC